MKNRVLFRLKSTFLFSELSDSDTHILINAMEERIVEPGVLIIREGKSDRKCIFWMKASWNAIEGIPRPEIAAS